MFGDLGFRGLRVSVFGGFRVFLWVSVFRGFRVYRVSVFRGFRVFRCSGV